uniref:Solute carrier family 19 member 3a n=1 Tax=Oryzias melastigma TaxID=30732 RepID=A0A3B3BD73_ORYME
MGGSRAHVITSDRWTNMEAVKRWRSSWRFPTTLLCIYGFFSTVKPLEPFLIPFLTGPDKNLTTEQVNGQIFPVWTYSYLSVLVPVFLLTDWLRYKPVLMFQSAVLFITTALLRWADGVAAMQAMQFFYGVVTASDVAYFSYIYSVVDLKRYRKATSYSRSVQLLGYTVGSILGQVLVSFDLMSYNHILVFTMVLTASALVTSCFLPMPEQSMFFHPNPSTKRGDADSNTSMDEIKEEDKGETEEHPQQEKPKESADSESCGQVVLQLWRDFCQCYSSRQLLYWSLWWAMATCGYNQTVNYVQVLWEHVQPSQNFSIYNGGVEAASNLLSERPHPQNSPHQTELCSKLPSSCRCRHCLQRRLHRGQVGAVGGAGPGGFLWTGSRRAVSHDFRWKHLGVLLRLCRLQVPVHAAHNDSNVPDCSRAVDGKVRACVWGKHVWSSGSPNHHHVCGGGQRRARPDHHSSVHHICKLLPGHLCGFYSSGAL